MTEDLLDSGKIPSLVLFFMVVLSRAVEYLSEAHVDMCRIKEQVLPWTDEFNEFTPEELLNIPEAYSTVDLCESTSDNRTIPGQFQLDLAEPGQKLISSACGDHSSATYAAEMTTTSYSRPNLKVQDIEDAEIRCQLGFPLRENPDSVLFKLWSPRIRVGSLNITHHLRASTEYPKIFSSNSVVRGNGGTYAHQCRKQAKAGSVKEADTPLIIKTVTLANGPSYQSCLRVVSSQTYSTALSICKSEVHILHNQNPCNLEEEEEEEDSIIGAPDPNLTDNGREGFVLG
ncbi:hypothetical protein FB451DRAFT_1168931 [Mycena latifolia]|nr:hypothetical protein FB451DRAFT_1168931 [Mycena latifolia]